MWVGVGRALWMDVYVVFMYVACLRVSMYVYVDYAYVCLCMSMCVYVCEYNRNCTCAFCVIFREEECKCDGRIVGVDRLMSRLVVCDRDIYIYIQYIYLTCCLEVSTECPFRSMVCVHTHTHTHTYTYTHIHNARLGFGRRRRHSDDVLETSRLVWG